MPIKSLGLPSFREIATEHLTYIFRFHHPNTTHDDILNTELN